METNVKASRVEGIVITRLRPMREAPRDGTEILAYSEDGRNFHPVYWKGGNRWKWYEGPKDFWACRWSDGYSQCDGQFLGWVPYPSYSANYTA